MAKKSKAGDNAKLAKRYAKIFAALAELSSTLDDLQDEDIVPANTTLNIQYSPYPAALKVEGHGRKFVLRLDDYDG